MPTPIPSVQPAGTARTELESLLLALLGGSRRADRVRELLERLEWPALSRAGAAELEFGGGLTASQAERLAAAFALGRAVEQARRPLGGRLRSPARVAALLAPELRGLVRETFHVLMLDAKHRLFAREKVSEGTLTTSLVHPREVFRPAIRLAAAAVVVVHNHPSGDPEPSGEDLAVTRRLVEVGQLLGIPLLDHVVVADGAWVSIRDRLGFESG